MPAATNIYLEFDSYTIEIKIQCLNNIVVTAVFRQFLKIFVRF